MQAMVPRGVHDTVAEDLSWARDEVERLKRSMAGTVSSSEMALAEDEMRRLKAELERLSIMACVERRRAGVHARCHD